MARVLQQVTNQSRCNDDQQKKTLLQGDPQASDFEPITGYLNRQCPRWFGIWGKCWTRHKVIFDGEALRSFSLPGLKKVDELPITGIDRVVPLRLVAPRSRVVPPDARAEAPPGEIIAPGLSIYDVGGKEIVFCADSEAERNRWRHGLNNSINCADNAGAVSSSTTGTNAKQVVTQGKANGKGVQEVTHDKGKGKGKKSPPDTKGSADSKGKGKGKKGKPARPVIQNAKLDLAFGKDGKVKVVYQEKKEKIASSPAKTPSKKIPGFGMSEKPGQLNGNTIFNPVSDEPMGVNPSIFVSPTTGDPNGGNGSKWIGFLVAPRDEIKLLADKEAQELGVVAARLDMHAIAAASFSLDSTYRGFREKIDGVEILNEVLVKQTTPVRDPLMIIRKHAQNGGDISKLRKIERSLVPLSKVPRAIQRLRLLHLEATFDDRLNNSRRRLDILAAAAQHLESSGHNGLLRDVVRLIQESLDWNLSQTTSSSGRRASRRAFHIGEQLMELKNIRPAGNRRSQLRPGYNFIHFIVDELFRFGHDIPYGAFAMEVPQLQLAAKTNPSLIYEDLKWIQAGSRTATFELREHAASYATTGAEEDRLPGDLPRSGRVAAVTAELLSARETARQAVDNQSDPPTRAVGPECFLLSTGGDEAFDALRHEVGLGAIAEGMTAETYEIDGVSCGRPTMLADSSPLHCAAPRKWDPRQLLAKDRIRKVHLHKPGTFARAARASTASGLQGLSLSRVVRPSSFREVGGQGFLWLFMPHKTRKPTWHRCYADVRAHHLIVRLVHKGELGREAAVSLPGADIFRLDFLLSSSMSRHLASLGMLGLELRPQELDSPVIVCFDTVAALERWESFLMRECKVAAVGYLMMRVGERHGRRDTRLMCVVDPDAQELRCYNKSLDLALGSDPKLTFNLDPAPDPALGLKALEVHSLDPADESGTVVKGAAQESGPSCSLGFRLLEREEGVQGASETSLNCVGSFVVVAPGDPKQWLGILQTICIAGELQNNYTPFGPLRESLVPNMAIEEDPFSKLERLRPSCAPGQSAPVGITSLIPEAVEQMPPTQDRKEAPQTNATHPSESRLVGSPIAEVPEEPTSSGSDSDGTQDEEFERSLRELELSDDDDSSLETGPLANLRRLSRKLRCEAKSLDEELRAEECAASTTLAFFDERASPGCALAPLQKLLWQVAEFAKDFDAVVKRVKDEGQNQGKPKAKARANGRLRLQRTNSMREAWVVEPKLEPVQATTSVVEPKLEPSQPTTSVVDTKPELIQPTSSVVELKLEPIQPTTVVEPKLEPIQPTALVVEQPNYTINRLANFK